MFEDGEGVCRLPSAGTACSKLIFCIMPVAQILVGALHQHECPRQPFIPIYLEVMGAYSLLYIALSYLYCLNNLSPWGMATNIVNILFGMAWFFTGNWWIYSIYQPNYNKTITDVDPYCDKTLYLFAFWTTNVFYIQFALFVCFCFICPRLLPDVFTGDGR